MTADTTQHPLSGEPNEQEIADWEARLVEAEAAGPDAVKALIGALKRRFPGGHRLIKKALTALAELERSEGEKRERERATMRPRVR